LSKQTRSPNTFEALRTKKEDGLEGWEKSSKNNKVEGRSEERHKERKIE